VPRFKWKTNKNHMWPIEWRHYQWPWKSTLLSECKWKDTDIRGRSYTLYWGCSGTLY